MIGRAGLTGGLLLLLTTAGAASAQPASPAPATEASAAAATQPAKAAKAAGMDNEDRIVCQSVRHTGSRMPVRTCKTKREIRLAREKTMDTTERLKQSTKQSLGRKRATF